MKLRNLVAIGMLVALLFAGALLVAGKSGLAAETSVRQGALARLLAPVGMGEGASGEKTGGTTYRTVAEPVLSIPVRDMPVGEYFPETDQYARWLNGEVDMEFEGIPPAMRQFLEAEAMRLPATEADPDSPLGGPSLLDGFDSLDSNECCGGGTVVPPDPEMSAGQDYLIAVVNLALEIYDKDGNSLVGPVTYGTFFAPLGSSCSTGGFDPNTIYDESADRYIIGVDGDGTSYCIAISQTSDATGPYYMYKFNTNAGLFFDYPHAGVGNDAIYVGANLFGSGQGWVYALDKPAMYSGGVATMVGRSLNSPHETPQPMNLHGWLHGTWPAGGPHYIFAGSTFSSARNYVLYSWDDPFGANLLTLEGTYDLQAIHGVPVGSPLNAQQQGGMGITGNDPRPLDFEYRNGSGWTAMTVSCNPGSGTVNCVQWAEVDLATQTIAQTDVFATNGQYRYFPDFAADHCGNAMVGYTQSSTTSWPSTYAAGPVVAGFTPGDTLIKAGEVVYSAFANRWGDYTGMTIDPDGVTFWYLGEYSKNNGNGAANWGDYVGKLTFDCATYDFSISATPETQDVCIPDNAVYDVDLGSFGGFGDPVTLSAAGHPAGTTTNFNPNPVNPPGSSTLTIGNTAVAAPGDYVIDITGMAPTSTHSTSVMLTLYDAAATVALTSPADGATNVPLTPTFNWTGTGTSYFIEIATDAGFTNIVDSATTSDTSYTSIPLNGNTTYYWRVTADNVCGGDISETWSFTTAGASLVCGATEGFEAGVFPGDWSVTTSALPGGEWVVSTNNSSAFWDPGPAPEGIYYASANDDLPGSGSNGANDYLYTNIIDLSGVVSASLDFWYHFDGTFGHAAGGVEVSGDGGTTWDGEIIVPINPNWQQYSLNLNAYAGNSNVQIRFHSDDGGFWAAGYAIDAVSLVCEGGDQPDIFVDPLAIASTQNTNTVTNWPLDIENVGTANLNWNIDEDNSLAGPISGGVVPPANQVTVGELNFSGSGLTGATVTPERETPAGLVTITHSATQNIVSGNSVSCNDGFGHTDNSYIRVFDLESFGIFGPFDVVEVEIGIEATFTAGGSQPATMNLYLWDEGDPFTFANFALIGSANTTVFDGDAGTIITVPVAGSAPAGSNLVVEFFTPNGQAAGNLLWVGSNPDGQTSPTYLAAADCGVPEPTDTAALGFPGMHMVMNVTGDTDAGPATCDAPDDIPWASVAPDNGTTAPGDTDTVTVTFDSTGLAAGTYNAALCVTSNDPDPGPGNGTELVVVDLELTVEQPTDVGLSGIGSDSNSMLLPALLVTLLAALAGVVLILRRRSIVD